MLQIESPKVPGRSRSATQLTQRAGEFYVAAELNRRGAFATPFSGNLPAIDIVAFTPSRAVPLFIQVKTKTGAWKWQTRIVEALMEEGAAPSEFYVFVALGIGSKVTPRYWIVPRWWINNDIYHDVRRYLKKHGGQRPGNPDSKHWTTSEERIVEWEDRWDIMGLSPP